METSYSNRIFNNRFIESKELEGSESTALIDVLIPDELLKHIFSFLKPEKGSWNVILVCWRWCVVGREQLDPSFDGNFWLIAAIKAKKFEAALWLLSDKRVNLSQLTDADKEIWFPLNKDNHKEVASDEDSDNDSEEEVVKKTMTIGERKKSSLLFALELACENSYAQIVQKILTLNIDPNEMSKTESNGLTTAGFHGQIDIVRLLLKDPKVDPHFMDDMAFCMACKNGPLEVIEEYLSDPRIEPSQRTDNAPLVLSMANLTSAVALRLLDDPRIDPSRVDNQPLHEAVAYRKLDVVKRLMNDPRVKVSINDFVLALRAFHSYLEGDELFILQLLEDKDFDLPEGGVNQILQYSMGWLPIKIFEILFKEERIYRQMDIHKILRVAVLAVRVDVVELLLKDPQCDPSMDENRLLVTALQLAFATVKVLLKDEKVNKTMNVCTIMNAACRYGRYETVETLLNDPRNPLADPKDESLELASLGGHHNIVRLLLTMQFDSSRLHVALFYASEKGHLGVVKVLLQDARIDPSANGNQALIIAAKNKHTSVFNELLKDSRVKELFAKQRAERVQKGKS